MQRRALYDPARAKRCQVAPYQQSPTVPLGTRLGRCSHAARRPGLIVRTPGADQQISAATSSGPQAVRIGKGKPPLSLRSRGRAPHARSPRRKRLRVAARGSARPLERIPFPLRSPRGRV